MSWEIITVGCLILIISAIAILAMRKNRKSDQVIYSNTVIDWDELASKIAKATSIEMHTVLKELLKELKNIKVTQVESTIKTKRDDHIPVTIDESIIPININVNNIESSNLGGAATEQKIIDKGIEKSKSKLAEFLKKKE